MRIKRNIRNVSLWIQDLVEIVRGFKRYLTDFDEYESKNRNKFDKMRYLFKTKFCKRMELFHV
jgi:hypothetical protein